MAEAGINLCQCTPQTKGNDIVVVMEANQQNENDDSFDDQTEHATHQQCIDGTFGNFAYPISAQIGTKRHRNDNGQQVQHPQEGTRSGQRKAIVLVFYGSVGVSIDALLLFLFMDL